MSQVTTFLKRNRSYNFWDLSGFFFNFVFTFAVIGIGLYVSTLLSLPQGQNMSGKQWLIVILGSVALVVFTYVRELIVTKKKEQRVRGSKLVFDCIGGAIERLIELKACPPAEALRFINELLNYAEKIVRLLLDDYNLPQGELCANLMIKKSNPDRLELEYFGTFLSGRAKLTLEIDPSSLRPGAPEAYYYRRVMYVDNTMSEKYREFFDERKPYRSIVSIPIPNMDGSVFAVLNIDSNMPGQFMSGDFINKKVIPTISPLIALLRLEKELIVPSTAASQ